MHKTFYRLETETGRGAFQHTGHLIQEYLKRSIEEEEGLPHTDGWFDSPARERYLTIHPTAARDSKLRKILYEDEQGDDDVFVRRREGARPIHHYKFGFKSIEQLRTWFYDEDLIAMLHKEGIMVMTYSIDVPDDIAEDEAIFLEGSAQIMYIPEYATRINMTPFTPEHLDLEEELAK